MQIFTDTHFDFMGKRAAALLFSGALLVASVGAMAAVGFNFGIDFRGGTEIEVKFVDEPDLSDLRSRLADLGLADVSLQRVGAAEERTVLVRARDPQEGADVSRRVVGALYDADDRAALAAGRVNLNAAGQEEIGALLEACPTQEGSDAAALAEALAAARTGAGVLRTVDALGTLPGMTPDVLACIEARTFLPDFALWKDYFVGPKVGEELRRGAFWAVGFALAGILAYLWYRFQFQYGLGAVVALFHDVVITTGVLVLLREEFSLTVVAALLTLAGYSVNDTIVVFDRIRENLRVMRTQPLREVIDRSVNQTLSRTVLTGGTTLLVVVAMLAVGGPEFRGFALALLIGVVVGTYSSIFIASPLVLAWHDTFLRKRARRVARA
jgi:preprotein translocase subunit SecF